MSFFRYHGINKLWGMKQMYGARAPMRKMPGLVFFKPLGSGSGVGYSIWPDWSVWGMLGVWQNEESAKNYLNSALYSAYKDHCVEHYTIFLKPISSRGSWSGFSDWQFSDPNPQSTLIAALTRATLKTRFLLGFWAMVPRVSREHEGYRGLLFTKGVGEIPLMEQATFSVWSDVKAMEEFAYQTFHGDAVKITRQKKGFSEEMFTRLKPYKAVGQWRGVNPLAPYLEVHDRK